MLKQDVDSMIAKIAGKPKLQNALIVPFVWQTVGIVELVKHLSFQNGQQATNKVASQLRIKICYPTQQYIVNYKVV